MINLEALRRLILEKKHTYMNATGDKPNIVVYISCEFEQTLKEEIYRSGSHMTDCIASDVFDNASIMGYPIFVANARYVRVQSEDNKHPEVRIVVEI